MNRTQRGERLDTGVPPEREPSPLSPGAGAAVTAREPVMEETATVGQANMAALTHSDVLASQRSAVREFRETEAAWASAEATAEFGFDAVVRGAERTADERRGRAAHALEKATRAALATIADAELRHDAGINAEVKPAVQRAHEFREKIRPVLDQAHIEWVREPCRVDLPAAPDPGAQLIDAVARTEAAVQPLMDAVYAFEKWNRTQTKLLTAGATAAFFIFVAVWLAIPRENSAQHNVVATSTTEANATPTSPAPASSGTVSATESVSPRITLQYQVHQDAGEATRIQQALREQDGWRVGSPERVLPDAVNRAEVYGGVRFFFEEDSVLARRVCEVIRNELADRGYDVTFPLWPMVTLQRQGHFRARRGLIEVWISPLPPPIRGGDPSRMGRCGR